MSTTRELFGGAITVALPSNLIDASYVQLATHLLSNTG
jgi:hypothetical protein